VGVKEKGPLIFPLFLKERGGKKEGTWGFPRFASQGGKRGEVGELIFRMKAFFHPFESATCRQGGGRGERVMSLSKEGRSPNSERGAEVGERLRGKKVGL